MELSLKKLKANYYKITTKTIVKSPYFQLPIILYMDLW